MKQRRTTGHNFEVAVIWADRLTFAAHSHDEYVLSCNVSGNEKLNLDGRSMDAAQTCTTLYNPGQVQSGDGTECLVSIYLDPAFFEKEFLASRNISFDAPIVNDPLLLRQFTELMGLVFQDGAAAALEEKLFSVIGCVTERYADMPCVSFPKSDDCRVRRVKEMLMDRLDEATSLDDIAREMGLNKLAMLRMFAKATGVPPITWQRAKRIEAGRTFLKQGKSAAEAAYLTGFADQSHFTRWFGRAYGISPVRFARR